MNHREYRVCLLITFLFTFISCAHLKHISHGSGIEGTVVYNKKFITGAYVFAYKDFSSYLKGNDYAAFYNSTDIDGKFSLDLPIGNYIIVVKSKSGDENYFSYFGGNPVNVLADKRTNLRIGLVKVPSWFVIDTENRNDSTAIHKTGLSGTILHNDSSLPNADVLAFLDAGNYFRGPSFAETSTDIDGNFNLDLPSGSYYIVVRKRNSQNEIGPIKPGDFFGYYYDNPVEIKDKIISIFINAVMKEKDTSDTIITASGTFLKEGNLITGKIVDLHGEPAPNIYAGLYKNSDMIEKPVFISNKTDESGKFEIFVNQSGKYFLGARSNFGGQPKKDDYLGWYTQTPDHSIEINGKKENVIIIVEPVPASGE